MLRRPTGPAESHDLSVPFDELMASRYPTVWSYLSDAVYEDGSSRQTSSLVVFVEDGLVKVCLSDRDQERSAFAAGSCLLDALEAINVGLETNAIQWRRQRQQRKKGK